MIDEIEQDGSADPYNRAMSKQLVYLQVMKLPLVRARSPGFQGKLNATANKQR